MENVVERLTVHRRTMAQINSQITEANLQIGYLRAVNQVMRWAMSGEPVTKDGLMDKLFEMNADSAAGCKIVEPAK